MSSFKIEDFDSFCKVIEETLEFFNTLILFENNKLDAIAANDVALLDQYTNQEHAHLMQMRGLDRKREKIQAQFGMDGLTFLEIIKKFENPQRETLDSLYAQLSAKSAELKHTMTGTKRYIDLHLNSISALLERLEGAETTYSKNGEKDQKTAAARFVPTKA